MKIENQTVELIALRLGFSLVGFTDSGKLEKESEHLAQWLARNYHAGMEYMERNTGKRYDITTVFPGAKSVISLGMNYYTEHQHSGTIGNGKISRYAWGKDYHLVMWDKLNELLSELKELDPDFDAISYVDTGPVMDKAWAVKSGLGWMGKHTNVINRELGSWFFIATIITNYQFERTSTVPDFCGSCTACLDACPTDAFPQPYVVDASRCISYLTIENKGEIPEEYKGRFDNWLFGCDICQEVCPWNNKFSVITGIREFEPVAGVTEMPLQDVVAMDSEAFKARFAESPIKRSKPKGLKRNAEFLLR